jgi:phosphoadenosine phosphosulfate reductase
MIHDYLEKKINDSKEILKLAADMSKEYYHNPLLLTYSGGKDSDVLVQLALECLNPNDFEVMNSHTTVDAPETVYYIRDKFKELGKLGVKATVKLPRDKDGKLISIWSLIETKQIPPTRLFRYCCAELKETSTPNRFIATGVREAESVARRGRDIFVTRGSRKADANYYSTEHIKEVFEDDRQRRSEGGVENPNEQGVYDCLFISKAKKNDDLICNPIYKWTDSEVWEYINDREINYNPLYDKGFTRVGCIGCPMAGNQVKELEMYPKYKQNYINAFERMVKARRKAGKMDDSKYAEAWKDGEHVYKWWIGDDTIDGQMNIFDYTDKEE